MLVLTRRVGESIVIGNDVTVNVIQTHGNQVQIGISAPSDIPVYRLELYKQVSEENLKAASKETEATKRLAKQQNYIQQSGEKPVHEE